MVSYGDVMIYQPSFGEPKRVRVMSESVDEEGFVRVKFVERSDFIEFQEMGIGEVVDEIGEIVRIPLEALRSEHPSDNATNFRNNRPINVPSMNGGRRRRPSTRRRRHRSRGRSRRAH